MKIAKNVEALEITSNMMGQQSTIYPTLVWDEDTVILFDAGFPGQLKNIREAVEKVGVPFEKLNKVIITHQDVDHIGGLPELLKEAKEKVEVLAHEEEKAYIQGDKPLLKMNPERMKKLLDNMPEERKRMMTAIFNNPPKANVDRTVSDGEELPWCGGIKVIFTPGHTTGHVCLYLAESKTLISGDELVVENGELRGPRPSVAADIEEARRSIKKLTQFDIQTVICYHGGVYNKDVNKRLLELADE